MVVMVCILVKVLRVVELLIISMSEIKMLVIMLKIMNIKCVIVLYWVLMILR